MPHYLQNNAFQLILHPDKSSWDIRSQDGRGAHLSNVRMSIYYRAGREHVWALEQWNQVEVSKPEAVVTSQRPARQITVRIGPDRHKLVYQLLFALPEQEPVLM